jgi:nicotinamidase-related amidase
MARATSVLLVVDVQARLVPALEAAPAMLENAERLAAIARDLEVPIIATEQNPRRLGATLAGLAALAGHRIEKMRFNAAESVSAVLPAGRVDVIITGCEAHICVLQTALGFEGTGHRVFVVGDAIASRKAASKKAALERMRRHGIDIVSTEMVVFEWLETAEHEKFRDVVARIK